MLITPALANEIVSRSMAIIHHNVNVIDHRGRIIASGERYRIGELHEIAREVIRTRKRISIHNATEAARFKNVHPGINHPIMVNDKVAMVIGISGEPSVISRYAELAILTAELLVRQALEMREINWRQRLHDTLFSQYLKYGDTPEGYQALHHLQGLGIELCTPVVPVVVVIEVSTQYLCEALSLLLRKFTQLPTVQEVLLSASNEILLLGMIKESPEVLLEHINFILSSQISQYYIGVGVEADNATDIREAIHLARSVIDAGMKVLPQRRVYYFREMAMFCLFRVLENSYMVNFFNGIIRQLLLHDANCVLLETLERFIENNAQMGKTSRQLGIHRNTLSYRLRQIKKQLHLDPLVFTDLVQLSVSVYCYRRQFPRQSEWIDSLS